MNNKKLLVKLFFIVIVIAGFLFTARGVSANCTNSYGDYWCSEGDLVRLNIDVSANASGTSVQNNIINYTTSVQSNGCNGVYLWRWNDIGQYAEMINSHDFGNGGPVAGVNYSFSDNDQPRKATAYGVQCRRNSSSWCWGWSCKTSNPSWKYSPAIATTPSSFTLSVSYTPDCPDHQYNNLSWGASTGATRYEVQYHDGWSWYKPNCDHTPGADCGYVLAPTTTYTQRARRRDIRRYRVKACNNSGCTGWKTSSVRSPVCASQSCNYDSSKTNATLSWISLGGHYSVTKCCHSNAGICSSASSNSTSSSGDTLNYTTTQNSSDSCAYTVNQARYDFPSVVLQSLNCVSPPSFGSLSITYTPDCPDHQYNNLSWSASTGATRYEVQYHDGHAFYPPANADGGQVSAPTTNYIHHARQKDDRQYRVRACNNAGCSSWKTGIVGSATCSNVELPKNFNVIFVANKIDLSKLSADVVIKQDVNAIKNPPPGFGDIYAPLWKELVP